MWRLFWERISLRFPSISMSSQIHNSREFCWWKFCVSVYREKKRGWVSESPNGPQCLSEDNQEGLIWHTHQICPYTLLGSVGQFFLLRGNFPFCLCRVQYYRWLLLLYVSRFHLAFWTKRDGPRTTNEFEGHEFAFMGGRLGWRNR